MDGLGATGMSYLNDFLPVEVAVLGGCRTNPIGLIGLLDVKRLLVGIGVDGYSLDSQFLACRRLIFLPSLGAKFLAGTDNAAGDFASVGDEDFIEHGVSSINRELPGRRKSGRLPSCPISQV